MRIVRYAVAAGLSVVLVLSLACGRKDDAAGGTVRLWHIQVSGPTKDVVDRAVGRVQARHPDVRIEAVGFKNDPYKTKLRLAMESGDPPDVFHTWGGGGLKEWIDAGKVMVVPWPTGETFFNDSAMTFCNVAGTDGVVRPYALPADLTAVVFWYNRELFGSLALAPPKTLAAFKDVCAKLKAAGTTPVALGNAEKWPGCFYFIYFSTRIGGAEPFESRRLGDPSFVAAGDRISELVRLAAFSRGFNGVKYDGSRREFFTGRAAMTLMGSWILSHARAEAPEFLPKMDCFPFPAIEGGKGLAGTVVGGMNAGYAVSAATKHREVALDLLWALAGRKAADEWAATGRIPARTDVDLAGADRATQSLMQIMKAADGIQLYYDQALSSELGRLHKETTQAIFAGTKTGAETAAEMAKAARREAGGD